MLCVDGLKDEPQFIGNLPFDFSQDEINELVRLSKEAETPLKVNVFHDIEPIDQDEFDAHLYMHEHNKMNLSLSDEERTDYMRESMANESEESWTCELWEHSTLHHKWALNVHVHFLRIIWVVVGNIGIIFMSSINLLMTSLKHSIMRNLKITILK